MPAKFQFIDYTSEYTIQLFTFTTVLNNEIQYCVERTAVFTQNRTIKKLTIVVVSLKLLLHIKEVDKFS